MQEEWIRWNPIGIPEGQYIVTSIIQDEDGTRIILDDEKNVVKTFFRPQPLLVTISEESTRMRTWREVQLKYNDDFFFRDWFLYRVENSRLSKWILEEGCGFNNYLESRLIHYCIVTSEDVIDVVADTGEPELSISPVK